MDETIIADATAKRGRKKASTSEASTSAAKPSLRTMASAAIQPKFKTMSKSSTMAVSIPEPGVYQAAIEKMKIIEGEHDLRSVLDISVTDADGVIHECDALWVTLFAEIPSQHAKTSVLREGRHWMEMLEKATGVQLFDADPWEAARELEGRSFSARVSRSMKNGVPGLRVNAVSKKSDA